MSEIFRIRPVKPSCKRCSRLPVPWNTVNVVTDRDTGRPRGFAFVEMTTDEEAAAAITQLDQTEMDGRRITVNEARPKQPRGDGGFQRRSEPRW